MIYKNALILLLSVLLVIFMASVIVSGTTKDEHTNAYFAWRVSNER